GVVATVVGVGCVGRYPPQFFPPNLPVGITLGPLDRLTASLICQQVPDACPNASTGKEPAFSLAQLTGASQPDQHCLGVRCLYPTRLRQLGRPSRVVVGV